MLLAVAVLRSRLPQRDLWGWTVITGLLMVTLTLEGISEGTARAGAANAAVLLNASPFFVLILSSIFLRERASPAAVLGLLVGFAGIVVMVSSQLGDIPDTGDFALGMALAFLGAVGWAVGVLMTKSIFTRHPDLDMLGFTTAQYVVGGSAAVVLAFVISGSGSTDWSSGDLWAAVAWIAIGASAIATLDLLRRAQADVGDDGDRLAVPRSGCGSDHGDRLRKHPGRDRSAGDGAGDRGRRDRERGPADLGLADERKEARMVEGTVTQLDEPARSRRRHRPPS